MVEAYEGCVLCESIGRKGDYCSEARNLTRSINALIAIDDNPIG